MAVFFSLSKIEIIIMLKILWKNKISPRIFKLLKGKAEMNHSRDHVWDRFPVKSIFVELNTDLQIAIIID